MNRRVLLVRGGTRPDPPGSDPESCPDSCGVYHVSPSPDGALVYFGGPGPAVIDVSDLGWQQVVQRADGMLVMVGSWAGEPRPFTVDVVDPVAGTIVDSIELDSAADGVSRWVDLDASRRYRLFTAGDGTLR